MMIKSLVRSLVGVTLFVVVIWLVASLAGYSIGLWSTLVGSLVLTAIINVITMMTRRSSRA